MSSKHEAYRGKVICPFLLADFNPYRVFLLGYYEFLSFTLNQDNDYDPRNL